MKPNRCDGHRHLTTTWRRATMQATRKVAVAGATGRVGRHVVDLLEAGGHEFVAQLLEWGRQGEVCYVPKMRTQPVAARTVAQALADLATDPESAPAPGAAGVPILEIAGPREERLVDLANLLA